MKAKIKESLSKEVRPTVPVDKGAELQREINELEAKLTGFTGEQSKLQAATAKLETERDGLLYKARIEGSTTAQNRLQEVKTKLIEHQIDLAELEIVTEQVATTIDGLNSRLEAIRKDVRIGELRDAADERLAIAAQFEIAMDTACDVLGEYLLKGNQMYGAASDLGHPSRQYQTQNRALDYIHWRFSKYLAADFNAPSQARKPLIEIDRELVTSLLNVPQLKLVDTDKAS